jgi:predicted metal-dependent HD superfamily phosphohydrolase
MAAGGYANADSFLRLLGELSISTNVALDLWNDLRARYEEAHRHYHNLEHINEMLALAASVPSPELELAIWYHDAIYDPKASDNEALSAALFQQHLGAVLSTDAVQQVTALVIATDHRLERPTDALANLIIEIDLAILGSSAERYARYAADIRLEYAFVSEQDYRIGRSRVLRSFLNRDLFVTERGRSFANQARLNLMAELEQLSSRVS